MSTGVSYEDTKKLRIDRSFRNFCGEDLLDSWRLLALAKVVDFLNDVEERLSALVLVSDRLSGFVGWLE